MRKASSRSSAWRGEAARPRGRAQRLGLRDRRRRAGQRRLEAGRGARASRPARSAGWSATSSAARTKRRRRGSARDGARQQPRGDGEILVAMALPERASRRRDHLHGAPRNVRLDAALPRAAATAPVLHGQVEREARIDGGDCRQRQPPKRRSGGRDAGRLEAKAISAQAARPSHLRRSRSRTPPGAAARGRSSAMPATAPASRSGRIAQLRIGRARHHAADVAECRIRPEACALAPSGRARSAPAASSAPPSAQSSISAPRIASSPPAAAAPSRRTSMHPPAAAAVRSRDRSPRRRDRASGRRRRRRG